MKIPNYKILKNLGEGGMGTVYLAEHELIKRKVAIKVLHKHLVSNEDFITRFRREAELLAKLEHPNIVRLNEYFEHEGALFLIMEYVDGKELDQYINKVSGPIVEKELVPMFKQILSAMGYAHKKGLVHRDIKPANILISKEGTVKILDFGIAKLVSEDIGLTKSGVQVGTVTYMSPEQVNAEEVDKLTDIYSLGVTLYQMAVGQSPYTNTTSFKTQMKIIQDPFPKAQDIYPGVSDKIENIINKATQKKKEDRYQSCEDFIKSFSKNITKYENIDKKKKRTNSTKKNRLKIVLTLSIILLFTISWFGYQTYQQNRYNALYDTMINSENLEEIIIYADRCLEIYAADTIHFYKGLAYYELEEYENSIICYSSAISLNKDSINYYFYRSYSYSELADYSSALEDINEVIKNSSLDAQLLSARSDILYYLNEFEKSLTDIDKAIELCPDDSYYLYSRSLLYYDLCRLENQDSILYPIYISIDINSFAHEISWNITDFSHYNNSFIDQHNNIEDILISGKGYTNNDQVVYDTILLTSGRYRLNMYDSYGDGWAHRTGTNQINLSSNDSIYYNKISISNNLMFANDKWHSPNKKYSGDIIYVIGNESQVNDSKLSLALIDINNAIEKEPLELRYYELRADIYYELGIFRLAITDYKNFLTKKTSSEANFKLAMSIYNNDKNNCYEALKYFDIAINLDSTKAEYFFYRGIMNNICNYSNDNIDIKEACDLGYSIACDYIENDN